MLTDRLDLVVGGGIWQARSVSAEGEIGEHCAHQVVDSDVSGTDDPSELDLTLDIGSLSPAATKANISAGVLQPERIASRANLSICPSPLSFLGQIT